MRSAFSWLAIFVTAASLAGSVGCVDENTTDVDSLEVTAEDEMEDEVFTQMSDEGKADGALSWNAVARLAVNAGMSCGGERVAIAVAVARAESAFKPLARLVNPGNGTDRGIWQINSKWHPNVSNACAYSPSCNARAMMRISSKGTKWSPWWTFKKGRHLQFMSKARAAQRAVCGG
jgi:hypothetical protein